MFLGSSLHEQAVAKLVTAFLMRLYFLMRGAMKCKSAAEGSDIIVRDEQPATQPT
jgi:hypothetical protein